MFDLSEKPVYFPNNANKYTLENPRLSPKFTCNVMFFQVVHSCLNWFQLFDKLRYFPMPSSYHIYDSSVEKHVLAIQKVWGSILRQG